MMPQPATSGTPQLPGTPAGAPQGPGASPMASPGGGAGNQAAAVAMLKGVVPIMYKLLAAFPFGSKENSAVQRALTALSPIAGKTEEDSLVPSAIQQMALAAKGGPLKNAPPVGISPAAPPGGASPEAA